MVDIVSLSREHWYIREISQLRLQCLRVEGGEEGVVFNARIGLPVKFMRGHAVPQTILEGFRAVPGLHWASPRTLHSPT